MTKRDGKNRPVGIESGISVDARLARVPWVLTVANEDGSGRFVAAHADTYAEAERAQTRWIEGSR